MSSANLGQLIAPSILVPQVGDYLKPYGGLISSTGAAPSVTPRIYVFPFVVPKPMTFSRSAADLILGQTSAAMWTAVYKWADGNPNAAQDLVADFGEISLVAAGSTTRVPGPVVTLPLASGQYFGAAWLTTNGVTAPTVMTMVDLGQSLATPAYASNQRSLSFTKAMAYPSVAPATLPTGLGLDTITAPIFYLLRSA